MESPITALTVIDLGGISVIGKTIGFLCDTLLV